VARPDLFLHATADDERKCAAVEDTVSGVIAAIAAGMLAVAYAADSDKTALRHAGRRDPLQPHGPTEDASDLARSVSDGRLSSRLSYPE
jgi:beta-phosphoglucomutase-like phosphatase (HAD superfamily)